MATRWRNSLEDLRETDFLLVGLIAVSFEELKGLETRQVVGFALRSRLLGALTLLCNLPFALLVLGLKARCRRLWSLCSLGGRLRRV